MPVVICMLNNTTYDCRVEDFVCLYKETCPHVESCDATCPKFFTCENCQFNEADC